MNREVAQQRQNEQRAEQREAMAKRRAEIADKKHYDRERRQVQKEKEREVHKPTMTKLNEIMPVFGNRSINHAALNTWK